MRLGGGVADKLEAWPEAAKTDAEGVPDAHITTGFGAVPKTSGRRRGCRCYLDVQGGGC